MILRCVCGSYAINICPFGVECDVCYYKNKFQNTESLLKKTTDELNFIISELQEVVFAEKEKTRWRRFGDEKPEMYKDILVLLVSGKYFLGCLSQETEDDGPESTILPYDYLAWVTNDNEILELQENDLWMPLIEVPDAGR